MKQLLFLLAVIPGSLNAQSWCAPGAIWTYQVSQLGTDFQRSMFYESDVNINGQPVQRIAVRDSGIYLGFPFVEDWFFYTVRIGDAVLYRSSNQQFWDTLYYYGVPGDRWWPMNAPDPECPGLLGMLEIADTCTVQIDGVAKRKWEVAMLDAEGQISPGTTMELLEGVGMVPFQPIPYYCTIIVEWYFFDFTSYTDEQIDFFAWPDWFSCDEIGTSAEELPRVEQPFMFPNPGSNGFYLSGSFKPNTELILSDAFGRVVAVHRIAGYEPYIHTSHLPAGIYGVSVNLMERSVQLGSWVQVN